MPTGMPAAPPAPTAGPPVLVPGMAAAPLGPPAAEGAPAPGTNAPPAPPPSAPDPAPIIGADLNSVSHAALAHASTESKQIDSTRWPLHILTSPTGADSMRYQLVVNRTRVRVRERADPAS